MEFKAKRRTLDIIVDSQNYSVRFPKTREQYELDARMKKAGDAGASEVLFEFLASLGLPREVVMELEPPDLLEIVQLLTGQKKS